MNQSASNNRTLWVVLGGIAVFAFFGLCVLAVIVGGFFTLFPTSRSARPVPTPQIRVERVPTAPDPAVPAPLPRTVTPGDGVDYETAVMMNIYQQANQSVVNVDVLALVDKALSDSLPENVNPDDFFPQGQGSGFVWDLQGHIVTNAHVVQDADQVQITFSDGTVSVAEVVGYDLDSDLAVLKIDPAGYTLRPVARGRMEDVQVGMRVAAIGNPFGMEGTLTSGIVSAVGRSIRSLSSFNIPEAIQTDAAINPGNSGGPLFNEHVEIIGVNAQILSAERSSSGVGFAIPISIVERVVPALIDGGFYEHSYIGIQGSTFSPICAEDLGLLTEQRGAYVSAVMPRTPAEDAGLRGGQQASNTKLLGICPTESGGDLITAIGGQPVTRFDDLLIFLERYTSPGDTIVLDVLRNGTKIQLELTLAARPSRPE